MKLLWVAVTVHLKMSGTYLKEPSIDMKDKKKGSCKSYGSSSVRQTTGQQRRRDEVYTEVA